MAKDVDLGNVENLLKAYLAPKKKSSKKRSACDITYKYDTSGKRIYHSTKKSGRRLYKKKTKLSIDEDPDEAEWEDETTETGVTNDLEEIPFNQLQEELRECSVTLKSYLKQTGKKKKSWMDRMEVSESQWKELRETILIAGMKKFVLPDKCHSCFEESPSVSCGKCGYLCKTCDNRIHLQKIFHDRLAFLDVGVHPLTPLQNISEFGSIEETTRLPPLRDIKCIQCSCQQEPSHLLQFPTDETLIIISLKGRFEVKKWRISCHNCGHHQDPFTIENIIASGYWPASPKKVNVMIDEEMFIFWDSFRKRMPGSSEKAFVDALNDISELSGRDGILYPQMISHSFKEWCFHKFELGKKKGFDFLECPCCSIYQHSCHVDGNCKLYRYKSSGHRRRDSFYKGYFIEDDSLVKEYLKMVYPRSKKLTDKNDSDFVCGGKWTAAKNIVRKKGKLSETGLEVGTCRHRCAQKALNMNQGELYGYPLYLMKNFLIPQRVEFVWSDVMCKLWGFANKVDPSFAKVLKPALSVMHAKGHSLECQMQWDGQWIEGTGRTTGEETEQYFGYIGRCSNTTKYQLPEGREETITELTLHWNWRKICSLSSQLLSQYVKNNQTLKSNKTEFDRLCQNNCFVYSKHAIERILLELKNSIPTSMKGSIPYKIEVLYFEKVYWKAMLKKIGDRSKRRFIIRKKLSIVKKKMELAVSQISISNDSPLSTKLEDCMIGKFPWKELNIESTSEPSISATDKRLLVDAFMKWQRSIEEKDLLQRDMRSFLQYYRDRIASLQNEVESKKNNSCNHDNGEITLLHIGISFCRWQLSKGMEYFQEIFGEEVADNVDSAVEDCGVDSNDNNNSHTNENDAIDDLEILNEFDIDLVKLTGESVLSETEMPYTVNALDDNSMTVHFAENLSQGTINERNGSTACVVISILVGLVFKDSTNVSEELLTYMFVGCMEIGNQICEENDVFDELTIQEAQEMLPPNVSLEIQEETNITLQNEEDFVKKVVDVLSNSAFAVMIIDGKAYSIVSKNNFIIAFDSHANPPVGAKLVKVNIEQHYILFQHFFNGRIKKEGVCYIATFKC